MSYIIGIDIGGSTTKIVGLHDGKLTGAVRVKASDPLTSAYGAFGKFMEETGLKLNEVDRVMCTGVGASYLSNDIYGIPATKVDEFQAIGLGGKYTSGLDDCIVASLGTGTSITSVKGDQIQYIGGSGVGGGTVCGLCGKMIGISSSRSVDKLALHGSLDNVDLNVGDISRSQIANMNDKTTAANFGNVSENASDADFAMGVVNLVFQTVGIIAKMAAQAQGTDKVVLTGSLTKMEASKPVIEALEALYHVKYIIPEHSDFSTAIGAALFESEDTIS